MKDGDVSASYHLAYGVYIVTIFQFKEEGRTKYWKRMTQIFFNDEYRAQKLVEAINNGGF